MRFKVVRVFGGKKSALVMIEPPGELFIIGIFEIHYGIFVAVEEAVLEDLGGAMGHAGVLKLGIRMNSAADEAAEEGGRSRPIKAVIVVEDSKPHSVDRERVKTFHR